MNDKAERNIEKAIRMIASKLHEVEANLFNDGSTDTKAAISELTALQSYTDELKGYINNLK